MRKILSEATKDVTQGTIFNNAMTNHYYEANGIIITARCDIENDHNDSVNYLPVVDLNHWLRNEYLGILLKRVIKECKKNLESIFEKKSLSLDALEYLGAKKIVEAHFTDNKKEIESVNSNLIVLEIYSRFKKGSNTEEDFLFIIKKFAKIADKILKELINNELSGYFYLENCDYYKQSNDLREHFVILLREVHSLPLKIAKQLVYGFDIKENSVEAKFFKNSCLAIALSEVTSPFIECIVQSCIAQFRIGIDRANYLTIDNTKGNVNAK